MSKHLKIWFVIYLGACLWNVATALTNDTWLGALALVLAIFCGLFALGIGIAIVIDRHKHSGRNA